MAVLLLSERGIKMAFMGMCFALSNTNSTIQTTAGVCLGRVWQLSLFLLDHSGPSVASCRWYFGWSFSFIVFCWFHGSICKLLSLASFGGSHVAPSRSLGFPRLREHACLPHCLTEVGGFLLALGILKGRIHSVHSLNSWGRKELCSLQSKQTKNNSAESFSIKPLA